MTKQFTPPRSSTEFDDLVIKEMKSQTTVAESKWLHEPAQLFRWHRALEQKIDEGERHIDNRVLMIERKRADYQIDDEADMDHLTDEENDDYYAFKDDMEARNRSTTQFLGYVRDAAAMVQKLISETPSVFDPAQVVKLAMEAREELAIGSAEEAGYILDDLIELLAEGMGS